MDHTYTSNRAAAAPGRTLFRMIAAASFAALAAGFAVAAPMKNADADDASKPHHGIIINHQFKLDLGLSCDICHSPSKSNPKLMAFPDMDSCGTCHADEVDMEKGTDSCTKCHSNDDFSSTVRKGKVLVPNLGFDHRVHAAAKVDCLSCHKVYDKVGSHGDEMLPTRSSCIACHSDRNVGPPVSHTVNWIETHGKGLSDTQKNGTCALCHTAARGNDCASCHLREAPKTHVAGWVLQAHSRAARTDSQTCATCHSQNQCIDCHTEQKPYTHNSTWVAATGHPLAAAANRASCAVCHSGAAATNSCASCHANTPAASHKATTWIHSDHPAASAAATANCSMCHTGAGDAKTCATCHSSTGTVAPTSHTGTWGGTTSGHCSTCHIDSATNSAYTTLPTYVARDAGSNCSFCHTSISHSGPHRESDHTTSTSCTSCHRTTGTSPPRIPHPQPVGITTANCQACHPMP